MNSEAGTPHLPVGPVDDLVTVWETEQHTSAPSDSADSAPLTRPGQDVLTSGMRPPFAPLSRTAVLNVVLASAFVVLVAIYLVSRITAEFVNLLEVSPVLGWAYLLAALVAAGALGLLAASSWRRYRMLRDVSRLRQLIAEIERRENPRLGQDHLLRRELEAYLAVLAHTGDSETQISVEFVRTKFLEYVGDARRDLDAMQDLLLAPLDCHADASIERRAAQVAVATALASRAFDPLIVSWQALALISEISQLYSGRPGLWGTLRLLRRSLALVVFADLADLAAQAAASALAQKSLALLGGRMAEGTANGLLLLRLGEAVKHECRPLPVRQRPANPVTRLAGALWNQGFRPATAHAAGR
jgi:uncharacterized membrane protein YcjF (UPF0283 family)